MQEVLPPARVCVVPAAWHHRDTRTCEELWPQLPRQPRAGIAGIPSCTQHGGTQGDAAGSARPVPTPQSLCGPCASSSHAWLSRKASPLPTAAQGCRGHTQQAGLQLALLGLRALLQEQSLPSCSSPAEEPFPCRRLTCAQPLWVCNCAANSEGLCNAHDTHTNWAKLLLEGCSLCQTSLLVLFVSILIKLGGIHIQ